MRRQIGFIEQIERKINLKMKKIQKGELTPKESNIGMLFNGLKQKDEVSYDKLMLKYKRILVNRKKQ